MAIVGNIPYFQTNPFIHDGSNKSWGDTNFTKDPKQQKRTPPAKKQQTTFFELSPPWNAILTHSFWHTLWKYIWHTYSDILSGIYFDILSDILSGIYWHTFWHLFRRSFWHSIKHILVELRQCPLSFGARSWRSDKIYRPSPGRSGNKLGRTNRTAMYKLLKLIVKSGLDGYFCQQWLSNTAKK